MKRWLERRVRTHLTVLCAIGAALVSACGRDGDRTTPTAPAPSPPPGAQSLAAIRLYEVAAVHAYLTTSPFVFAASNIDEMLWTSGPCSSGGSLQISLDGVLPAKGTVLPPGSHNLAVTFADCADDWLGIRLDGAASAAYTSSADLNELTALVSVTSMRGRGLDFLTGWNDATAYGSGTWTRARRDEWRSTTTYSPTIGSRLLNNLTGNVVTFGGGSYSTIQLEPTPESSSRFQRDYNNLAVAINGTDYILNGNILSTYDSGGSRSSDSHSGEVRITSSGTLVARVYGVGGPDARGLTQTGLRVEVFFPLVLL
jgi:hypothetical protein